METLCTKSPGCQHEKPRGPANPWRKPPPGPRLCRRIPHEPGAPDELFGRLSSGIPQPIAPLFTTAENPGRTLRQATLPLDFDGRVTIFKICLPAHRRGKARMLPCPAPVTKRLPCPHPSWSWKRNSSRNRFPSGNSKPGSNGFCRAAKTPEKRFLHPYRTIRWNNKRTSPKISSRPRSITMLSTHLPAAGIAA